MTFTTHTTQYIGGAGQNINLANFEIIVYHDSNKKNLHERTKKAKKGLCVLLVGEVDIHNDKLYIKLHNFEFITSSMSSYTTSPSLELIDHISPSDQTASKKRTQLYESLVKLTLESKSM